MIRIRHPRGLVRLAVVLLAVLQQQSVFIQASEGLPLNGFIRHFEPAHFPLEDLSGGHSRYRRSTTSSRSLYKQPVRFNFTAHNRLFLVSLHNSAQDIFSEDVVFENSKGPISFTKDRVYSGLLEDTPSSTVHGIVFEDGHFDGHISTPNEDFYIEPAHRYFPRDSQPFHTVIYKASDVAHPSEQLESSCKSHELHLKHKEDLHTKNKACYSHAKSFNKHNETYSNDALKKVKRDIFSQNFGDQRFEAVLPEVVIGEDGQPRSSRQTVTTYEVLDWEDVPESIRHHFRKKAKTPKSVDVKKRTCMLYLQADHLFYENMGSEEACIESMTRHVQRVNSIYNPIDFDQDGIPDNISFMIKRIKVHTSDALKDPLYRFPGNYGVEKFLELFSEENYDAFCLAYMFTYRDFEGGTLGLAWTGDLKNAGGVCERNGHYRGSLKSLNTGIITFLNYGKHVPPAVSHVTMAHEMGHNFGSPHDPENNKACVPGGDSGNYIMFARATSGDKQNNRNFSPCSLKSIKPVLLAKARGPKGCFKEPQTALCGNGVVEDGEECDCGWAEDCQEECCWPQRNEFPANERPCTLRPNKVCSPTQGPCCTNDCFFKNGDMCRDDNGCRGESFCNGRGPQCPNSDLKPNKTVCHQEFVCYKGECTGSICLAYGLESCQCSQGPDDPLTKSCELCCKETGDDKPCLSSFQLNEPPWDVPDMFSKPGTPCNNYKGYCDVFQKCREVDPSGPLATLRKLLLSEESIASLKKFLTQYWYTVIFIILGVLILMALIVKFCGKRTPFVHRKRRHPRSVHHETSPSDPESLIVHTEERPEGIDNGVQVHPAVVELTLPFGKKVRLGEKKKPRSKSRRREPESTSQEDSSRGVRAFEGVARATKLAANLSQRITLNLPHASLIVNPAEGQSIQPKSDNQQPKVSAATGRKTRTFQQHQRRPFKSLSPEKRLIARGLAETVSKSFEKLDLVSGKRIAAGIVGHTKNTKAKTDQSEVRSLSADADNRRRKRRVHATKETGQSGKEVTIAKLGRFKFSLEVTNGTATKKPAENSNEAAKDDKRQRKYKRKRSKDHNPYKRSEKISNKVPEESLKVDTANGNSGPHPSLVIVSKRQKSDRPLRLNENQGEKRSEEDNFDTDYRLTFGRKQKRTSDHEFSRSISNPGPPPSLDDILGAGEDEGEHIYCTIKRNNSFAGDPKKYRKTAGSTKLRRSETEKSSGQEWSRRLGATPAGHGGHHALLLCPKPAFENRAYDKSPEPRQTGAGGSGGQATTKHQQKSDTGSQQSSSSLDRPQGKTLKESGQQKQKPSSRPALPKFKASSLDTPGDDFYDSDSSSGISDGKRRSPPTQVQSLSDESSPGERHFGVDSSSDSELEIVVLGQKAIGSQLGVSRAKILDRVVKKESPSDSLSNAHLLASSLSSVSISPVHSSDDDLMHGRTKTEKSSNVEFIFPGGESGRSEGSAHSTQQHNSVSALSERFSQRDSSSTSSVKSTSPTKSATKKPEPRQRRSTKNAANLDLDSISIITDGMG